MKTLAEEVELIRKGWSPRCAIADRACLMRSHAAVGNVQRAEEYAYEIAVLQHADMGDDMAAPKWAEVWNMPLDAWADALIGGGYRLRRRFFAPIGCTADEAAAFAAHQFTATADLHRQFDLSRSEKLDRDHRTFAHWAA